jgi:hypothetical protein
MKKIILVAALVLWYNVSIACTTTTVMVNGKVTVCTVCPGTVVCN